jgi:sulfite reductase (NADPH) flavoprotein alpha-component
VYVQHLIADAGADVWALLARGAHVYVCGATSMGHDVLAAFEAVHEAHGGLQAAEAKAAVKALQAAGRYVQELWS